MNKLRTPLLAAICFASMTAAVPISSSAAAVAVYLHAPPPPAQAEITPSSRRGYVWTPGYWNHKHDRYVWQVGHWEKQRKGYAYVEPRWTEHENRWQLQAGHWDRSDRDGDGVSNGKDRAPDNPTRH